MAFRIPSETIQQLQISLREEAGIPSYDPSGLTLQELPQLEDSISRIDPSPPYLRCKHCKGRLIGGIKSLFCVFCGKEQFGEIPPDPIDFRATTGYRWLLDSLQLDESEVVELNSESANRNRGRSPRKDEIPLSDLLALEIPWHAKVVKHESTDVKATPRAKSPVNLGGVDLDNYFADGKGEVDLNESEEQFQWKHADHANETVDFQGQEGLSLFENAPPLTTPMQPKELESDDGQATWATDFQSAGSGAVNKDRGSFDPFAASSADLSLHMDTVFGSGNTNAGDTAPSQTSGDDWFQDNPRSNSNVTGSFMDPPNSSMNAGNWFQDNPRSTSNVRGSYNDPAGSSSMNVNNWFLDSQEQSASKNLNQGEVVDENDDSLDAWDDFTSSANQKDHPTNKLTHQEPTGMNLFDSVGDTQDDDFGDFQQPDLFAGAFNGLSGPENLYKTQLEASASDRTFNSDRKEERKAEDTTGTDVETIMSQMHNLSFMLDGNLSIPKKSSASWDRV